MLFRMFPGYAITTILVCCGLLGLSRAQAQEFTWMTGSSSTNQAAVYGTKGVPAPTNTPGACHYAVSWTDSNGHLWLYGGFNSQAPGTNQQLSTLWKYDTVGATWTWMHGNPGFGNPPVYGTKGVASADNTPGARSGSATWVDKSGRLWLFGGFGLGSQQGDLWNYNIGTNSWTWMGGGAGDAGIYGVQGVPHSENRPGARSGSVAWTDAAGDLWLFGGSGFGASSPFSSQLNDLWRYNISTGQWTWMKGSTATDQPGIYGTQEVADPANIPGARLQAVSWTDSAGNLWLFGGMAYRQSGGYRYFNDVWKYEIASGNWSWIKGSSDARHTAHYGELGVPDGRNTPEGRANAVGWTDASGDFWLYGGYTLETIGVYHDSLWRFQPESGNWTWMHGSSTGNVRPRHGTQGVAHPDNSPGARAPSHSAWRDNADNLWFFGGYGFSASGPSGYHNDLWKYTIPRPPVISPIPGQTAEPGLPYEGPVPTLASGHTSVTWSLVAGPTGMTLDSATGVVSWTTPKPSGFAFFNITIRATNEDGWQEVTWNLTVTPHCCVPTIDAISDQTAEEQRPYTGPTPRLLSSETSVTWSLVSAPPGMTVDISTGVVFWASPEPVGTSFTITLRATNDIGSEDAMWNLAVIPRCCPPVVEPLPDTTVEAGLPYTGPAPLLSSGSEPVTWALVSGPADMMIDASTGVVSWSLPEPPGTSFTITIRATNDVGSGEVSWQLSLVPRCRYSVAPVFVCIGPEGGTGTLEVMTSGTCSWRATSSVSWITPELVAGTGSATLTYSVEPNTTAPLRSGTISVAGQTHLVIQESSVPAATWYKPQQTLRVRSEGSGWQMLIYNYSTSRVEVSSYQNTDGEISYEQPRDEWVGIFQYDYSAARFTQAIYTLKTEHCEPAAGQ